jgi:YlmC/YmxH family sporulation protein
VVSQSSLSNDVTVLADLQLVADVSGGSFFTGRLRFSWPRVLFLFEFHIVLNVESYKFIDGRYFTWGLITDVNLENMGECSMVKISEFQVKDIVNIYDGKKLGNMSDLSINISTGNIDAIIVSGGGKVMGLFGREEEVIIPWNKIKKIGADVILVEHNTGLKGSFIDK